MRDWRETALFMVLWAMFMGSLVWLTGCTSMDAQREAQVEAQIQGTYTKGLGCRQIDVATGKAAVAAAQTGTIKYVEVQKPKR